MPAQLVDRYVKAHLCPQRWLLEQERHGFSCKAAAGGLTQPVVVRPPDKVVHFGVAQVLEGEEIRSHALHRSIAERSLRNVVGTGELYERQRPA